MLFPRVINNFFCSLYTPSHTACLLDFSLHAFISFIFATTLLEVVLFYLLAAFCRRILLKLLLYIFRSKSEESQSALQLEALDDYIQLHLPLLLAGKPFRACATSEDLKTVIIRWNDLLLAWKTYSSDVLYLIFNLVVLKRYLNYLFFKHHKIIWLLYIDTYRENII